jgi:sarcosine oxidase
MRYDVIVVGLGAFGASALWRLARRGVRVAGVEQFRVGHPLGSSHGYTRLFRVACLEHPGLVPIARESGKLWRELESETGNRILDQTGGLMVGPGDGRVIKGTRAAADRHGLAIRELDVAEVRERYPQHSGLPDKYMGLWDANAGVLRPETALESSVELARRLGADVFDGSRVTGFDTSSSGVSVTTATATLDADQVVLATGPWLSKLVPLDTEVIRTPLLWFRARHDPAAFELDRFPVFIRHYDDERSIWGHGATAGEPAKAGLSIAELNPADPDTLDRGIDPDRDWGRLATVLETAVPGLDPHPVKAQPCMITRSPDQQFLVGRLGSGRVVVAGGCSGHGFKHASGIGEALAGIVLGEDPFTELDFLDPNRFGTA